MSRAFPKISVVTPTRNRLSKLQACVESVLASSYPPDCFELVVVNDGSSDGTQNYLTHLAEQQNQVRVLHQERQGPAAARNRGLASANGELIAFTDDDCTVTSDWLLSIAKAMENPNVNALGGRVYGVGDHVIASYMEHIRALEPNRFSDGQVRYLVTANACFRKSLLEELGGFDEKFQHAGEDVEISFRLLQSGRNLDFFPSCRVYHHYENSSEEFLQRFYIYGVGSRYNFEKHKALVMWHRGADKQLLSWLAGDFKSGKVKPRGFFEIEDLLTRLHFSILDALRNIAYLAGYLLIQSERQFLELISQHEIEQLNYLKSSITQLRALRTAKTEALLTALCNNKLSLGLIDKIDDD